MTEIDESLYDFDKLKSRIADIKLFKKESGFYSIHLDGKSLYIVGAPIVLKKYVHDDDSGYGTFVSDSVDFGEFMIDLELGICERLNDLLLNGDQDIEDSKLNEIHSRFDHFLRGMSIIKQEFKNDATDNKLDTVFFAKGSGEPVADITIETFDKIFTIGDRFLPIYHFEGLYVGKKIKLLIKIVQAQHIGTKKKAGKLETKQEIKPEIKQEAKQEIKLEAKQEAKQEIKPEAKQEIPPKVPEITIAPKKLDARAKKIKTKHEIPKKRHHKRYSSSEESESEESESDESESDESESESDESESEESSEERSEESESDESDGSESDERSEESDDSEDALRYRK